MYFTEYVPEGFESVLHWWYPQCIIWLLFQPVGDVLAPKQLIQAHSILIVALWNTHVRLIASSVKLLPNSVFHPAWISQLQVRSLLLHFQCWFPVSLKNLARFWVFGFSFGFISCRPHGESASPGHGFHFLSLTETMTSHLKRVINTNCMCQIVSVVMTNRRFVWQKSQGFVTSLIAKLSVYSHLNYKRT